jgi:Transposase, Mutator family
MRAIKNCVRMDDPLTSSAGGYWDRLARLASGARHGDGNRESSTSWKGFVLGLKRRGLRASSLVSATIILSLKRAIIEALSEAYWQRCHVHFLRNALDYLPRKVADDCLIEGFAVAGRTHLKPPLE